MPPFATNAANNAANNAAIYAAGHADFAVVGASSQCLTDAWLHCGGVDEDGPGQADAGRCVLLGQGLGIGGLASAVPSAGRPNPGNDC